MVDPQVDPQVTEDTENVKPAGIAGARTTVAGHSFRTPVSHIYKLNSY